MPLIRLRPGRAAGRPCRIGPGAAPRRYPSLDAMGHATARSAYQALTERLNRFPQGAPPSELLHRILALLFTEEEAALVAKLPIRPFTAARAAQIWGIEPARAAAVLEGFADRGLLLDIEQDGVSTYVLPRRWLASSSSR